MEIKKIGRKWVQVRSVQINTCKAILGQLLLCAKQNSWTAALCANQNSWRAVNCITFD